MANSSRKTLFAIPAPDLEHIVLRSSAELAELRGKSLFLTGGTGFFGKWLVAALGHADAQLGLGLRLTVLSRDPGKFLARHPEAAALDSLRFQSGDAADFPLGEDRYDYVVHAAADTLGIVTAAQEEARARAIIDGTRRVLELARQCGARRLLHVSSGGVYGAAAGKLSGASEDEAVVPTTPYARAKREAEELCEQSGLDFTTARAFAFLGPHLALDAHYAAGNFLRDAHRGGPILVRGDGTALRSYLYPADLVVWLLHILLRGQRARAYNVGSDETVSTVQLARRIAGKIRPAPEVVIQSLQPQGPQNIYLPDIRRARTELNLEVAIPLDEAIARTLGFLDSKLTRP
jgi:nucleoside-diphosphate-sugar epimerase